MSDFWRIMDSCACGYIDHSPCVNPPYCMIKGEDYDCDQCVVTEEEKNKAVSIREEYEEQAEKQKEMEEHMKITNSRQVRHTQKIQQRGYKNG